MAIPIRKSAMLVLCFAVFVGSFAGDMRFSSIAEASLIASAEARVGRPLTPVSYAGVARRTTRRTVVATSAAVAATPVVVVAPPTQTCVDTVNPDGSVTRICR